MFIFLKWLYKIIFFFIIIIKKIIIINFINFINKYYNCLVKKKWHLKNLSGLMVLPKDQWSQDRDQDQFYHPYMKEGKKKIGEHPIRCNDIVLVGHYINEPKYQLV